MRPVVALVALALAAALAGCDPTPAPVQPESTGSPSTTPTTRPTSAPTTGPAPTEFDESLGAEGNRPLFDQVATATAKRGGVQGGRDFVDALAAAGFPKSAMEVTLDRTPTGLAADSIVFSVLVGEQCLIGQQMADGSFIPAHVLPVTGAGTCLIGDTRPIDW